MKIRIKNNSIRLRLAKTDIANLKTKRFVACKTVISGREVFEYALRSDESAQKIAARFEAGKITVVVPFAEAQTLTDTDEITIKGWQENGAEEPLFLLIEKDLQCLDPTHEDQSDMYENPSTSC
ncbi:hypothetical protein G3O08_13865 [Cryomorpha ignava]|uniref:Uncharacterized protein n=1 Tax=Cryomorpha ignava TaxID=101383 RepID=A0A7K3WSC1_9FLAO|nr:hypothetical protein [Cryomorpha ignava]NEN24590.1 hypothetical protein [Cryomorpha ignava]